MNLYEDVDIISFIRLSRLRLIGQVNRVDKERKVYNILYNQPRDTQARGNLKIDGWIVYCQTLKNAKLGTGRSSQGMWRRRPTLGCSTNEEEEESNTYLYITLLDSCFCFVHLDLVR